MQPWSKFALVALAALAVVPPVALARSSRTQEAPGAALAEARRKYTEVVDATRKSLLDMLTGEIRAAKSRSDDAAVASLTSEQKALNQFGVWPTSIDGTAALKKWLTGRRAVGEALAQAAKVPGRSGDSARVRHIEEFARALERMNDLVAKVEVKQFEPAEGWKQQAGGWQSPKVDALAPKNAAAPRPLSIPGARLGGYAFELEIERLQGSGGVVLAVPDHEGTRMELVLAGSVLPAPVASVSKGKSGPPRSVTLSLVAFEGAPLWLDCAGRVLLGDQAMSRTVEEGAENLGTWIQISPADARTEIRVVRASVRPLEVLEDGFFDKVEAAVKEQAALQDVLQQGRELTGTITWDDGDPYPANAKILSSSAKSAVLQVSYGAWVLILNCKRTGQRLTCVNNITVDRSGDKNFRHLSEVDVTANATAKAIVFNGNWKCHFNVGGTRKYKMMLSFKPKA